MRRNGIALLGAAALLLLNATAEADVYRCEVDGRPTYSDHPCGPNGRAITLAPDPTANARRNMTPNVRLPVSQSLADACWNAFRRLARDPTSAKFLSYFGEVADDGYPYLIINAVFTNRVGGPERRFVRCRLNEDATQIDVAASEAEQKQFFRSQMEH